jgi:arylsulfatase A-like enzyme
MNERPASSWARGFGRFWQNAPPPCAATALVVRFLQWGMLVGVALAVADYLLGGNSISTVGLLSVLGVGVLGGALHAVVPGLLAFVICRLPSRGPAVAASAFALAVFFWLCSSLEVWSNLAGRYRVLALGALAASAVFSVVLALPGWALAPRFGGKSWFERRRLRVRIGCALLAGVAIGIWLWIDRTQFPDLYAGAHRALRAGVLVLGTYLGVASGLAMRRPRRLLLWSGGAIAVSVIAAPWWLLRSGDLPEVVAMTQRPLVETQFALLREVTDFDRDGHSAFLGDGDCAGFDSTRSPAHSEIPGNGIDDNCGGGDGPSTMDIVEEVAAATSRSPVNVVLITIDTLRPDRMSALGYQRNTTPEIARWAASATRFTSAYTAGGWTTLAIPALLTGTYPRRLSWNPLVETNKYRTVRPPLEGKLAAGETARAHFLLPIDDPRPTLATLLDRRGMHTIAVVDSGFTQVLAPEWGFGRGFDEYRQVSELPRARRNDAGTANLAIERLKARPPKQAFFLWVHFFGPHAPSAKHADVPTFGETESDRYDHEVAFVDRHVGRLLAAVAEVQERPTVVVITADHGERFYNERSRGHGRDAAEDSIRVPLLIRAPGLEPGAVSDKVSLVDVTPTLLGVTETPAPRRLDGVDLRRPVPERTLFVDTFVRNADGTGWKSDLVAALRGERKLVRDRVRGTLELHSTADRNYPARNLLPAESAAELQMAMESYIEQTGGPPRVIAAPLQ